MRLKLQAAALTELAERYQRTLNRVGTAIYEAEREHVRRIQSELETTRNQLLQSGRLVALGEILSSVTHEMRNCLTVISGFASLLLRHDLDGNFRELVDTIWCQSEWGGEVTTSTLSISRQQGTAWQWISANEAVKSMASLQEVEMRAHGVELAMNLQTDLPQVRADFTQLQQVFLNISINAEQAMLEAHGAGTLGIRSRANGASVQIIFADDGLGIPAAYLSRLFDLFFTTKESGKGTGLGLSLCQMILDKHGGSVSAESKEGAGATFIVEIPVVDFHHNGGISQEGMSTPL